MFHKKITIKDRIAFVRHLFEMVGAGITTNDAILNFEPEGAALKKAVAKVGASMRRGAGISDAIKGSGLLELLDEATLSAGERAGQIDQALGLILADMEERQEFMANLKQSLTMPVVNLVAAILAIYYLSIKVLPQVAGSLKNFGNLPEISLKIFAAAEVFSK